MDGLYETIALGGGGGDGRRGGGQSSGCGALEMRESVHDGYFVGQFKLVVGCVDSKLVSRCIDSGWSPDRGMDRKDGIVRCQAPHSHQSVFSQTH